MITVVATKKVQINYILRETLAQNRVGSCVNLPSISVYAYFFYTKVWPLLKVKCLIFWPFLEFFLLLTKTLSPNLKLVQSKERAVKLNLGGKAQKN